MTFLLTSFLATPLIACPNLTGNYSCKSTDDPEEARMPIEITQEVRDGITYYSSSVNLIINDSEMFPADGKPHYEENETEGEEFYSKMTCIDSTTVETEYTAKAGSSNAISVKSQVTKKDGGLAGVVSGIIYAEGMEFPIDPYSIECESIKNAE